MDSAGNVDLCDRDTVKAPDDVKYLVFSQFPAVGISLGLVV